MAILFITHPATTSSNNRLGITFISAVVLHLVFIFSINFNIDMIEKIKLPPTMDVTLVNQESDKAPDKADYLAQHNQLGGGNTDQKALPSSRNPGLLPSEGNANENQLDASTEQPEEIIEESILSSNKESTQQTVKLQEITEVTDPKSNILLEPAELKRQIAEIEAELSEQTYNFAKEPKKKYITARTKAAPEAAYIKAWTKKIERVGNLNYPDQARRDKIQGSLTLSVILNPDGSVMEIDLRHSSGHKILDDAAKRIVELASPFSQIPDSVLEGNDKLVITRTWQFVQNDLAVQ